MVMQWILTSKRQQGKTVTPSTFSLRQDCPSKEAISQGSIDIISKTKQSKQNKHYTEVSTSGLSKKLTYPNLLIAARKQNTTYQHTTQLMAQIHPHSIRLLFIVSRFCLFDRIVFTTKCGRRSILSIAFYLSVTNKTSIHTTCTYLYN